MMEETKENEPEYKLNRCGRCLTIVCNWENMWLFFMRLLLAAIVIATLAAVCVSIYLGIIGEFNVGSHLFQGGGDGDDDDSSCYDYDDDNYGIKQMNCTLTWYFEIAIFIVGIIAAVLIFTLFVLGAQNFYAAYMEDCCKRIWKNYMYTKIST